MGVFLLSTVPGLQAYVWCVKDGGSSALELDTHGACAPSTSGQRALHPHSEHAQDCCTTSSAHSHEDTCEPCIDVPLDAEFSKAPIPQLKKISAAPHVPAWREMQYLRDLTPLINCTQLPHPPPYICTALLVQRTTVLII